MWNDNYAKYVKSITVTTGGSGYTKIPDVTLTGGNTSLVPSVHVNAFKSNVTLKYSSANIYASSNGIPDHTYGPFPNANDPNSVKVQDWTFEIPLTPVISTTKSSVPTGAIGVAINGVPIYGTQTVETVIMGNTTYIINSNGF